MIGMGKAIKQAFVQIFRNKGMSLTTLLAISSMMFIVGICFVIIVNLNLFTTVLEDSYDTIEVFLEDDINEYEAYEIINEVRLNDDVKSVIYRSKDDAMALLKDRWGENSYLLDSLEENPLPNSILIEVNAPELGGAIVAEYANDEGIEDINYYQETVDTITKITDFLQLVSIIIIVFLLLVSVIVVANTIKLTVFNRAKEITIMQYIGATSWYIRGPFLYEGIILGFLAALIATLITTLLYGQVASLIERDVLAIVSVSLINVSFIFENLMWIFSVMGISIGVWGSMISMRKFLGK